MPETPTRESQLAGRSKRKKAMTSKEIEYMKKQLEKTSKKTRTKLEKEDKLGVTEYHYIKIESQILGNRRFQTPTALQDFWDQNLREWKNRLEQARAFCMLNHEI